MTNKKISDHVREAAERAARDEEAYRLALVAAPIYAAIRNNPGFNTKPGMVASRGMAIEEARALLDLCR